MINGIINIHKEKGFTSHDVVAKLRGIVGQKKIGHTGTLDPDATGVLPVCLGKATKLCDMLTDKNKTYETVMLLGQVTDTQDISGSVLESYSTDSITEPEVRAVVSRFVGELMQVPPMYSALKVNGKKLYELAREGVEVERKARPITVYEIEILDVALPRVKMRVKCSKGTYIRTLCHDIGQALGCGACMEQLVRTQVSRFKLAESVTLKQVEEFVKAGKLEEILTPIDAMFEQYEAISLKPDFLPLVYNGNTFSPKHLEQNIELPDGKYVRIYNEQGQFMAIYKYVKETHTFKIEKMFFERE